MQEGLNAGMSRIEADTLAGRLKLARKRRGLSQEELAAKADIKQSDVSKLETGRMQRTTAIARLARALAVPDHWLEMGVGSEPAWDLSLGQTGEPPVLYLVDGGAQDLSHLLPIVPPPQLEWGQLMSLSLPERFTLVLRDDALGDQGARGHVAEFSTTVDPIEGRGVLFKDKDGNTYVRIYQVRRPGHWRAISSSSSAYAPLDSDADGLEVLAVMVGVKWA